jgi:hypothetical protein
MCPTGGQETHVILASRESIRLPGQADYNYVQEAIEFGSHWLMLAASQPGIENALVPQEVNELRDEIDRRQATVFRELQQLQRTHAAAPQRAALTACRRSMDRIHQLFHPTQEQRLEEADPACLMNAELLKIPGVSVEEDWTCATPPGALEHRILEQLSAGPVSWEEAFTQQLQSHSHHSARSLLQLDVWTEGQRQTLQKNLEQSHCAHAETLREQVRSISLRIEESQQIEMLPPQEAQELATRLNTLESRISRGIRQDQLRDELQQLRDLLEHKRDRELKKTQERVTRLSDFGRVGSPTQDSANASDRPGSSESKPPRQHASAADTSQTDPPHSADSIDDPNDWALDV